MSQSHIKLVLLSILSIATLVFLSGEEMPRLMFQILLAIAFSPIAYVTFSEIRGELGELKEAISNESYDNSKNIKKDFRFIVLLTILGSILLFLYLFGK